MIKFHSKHTFVAVALIAVSTILFGCASAQSLLSQGDTVGAIEKLAKNLSDPKKIKQDEVELFVSLYPSEVENRLEYTRRTVRDLEIEFTRSQGKSTFAAALKSKHDGLPDGSLITDDYDVRSLLRQAEDLERNLRDLRRIQAAVAPLPSEIGLGNVYPVEKFKDNFASMSATATKEIGAIYLELANCQTSGRNRREKESTYNLLDKAKSYDSSISRIEERRAEAAYLLAEDYLAGKTVDEKKLALDWYRKSSFAVTNYKDTTEKKKRANYETGILTMADIDVEGSVYAVKAALSNARLSFKEAGDYLDAKDWIAKIESIQYEIDHPQAAESTKDGETKSGSSKVPEGFVLIAAPTFVRNQIETTERNDGSGNYDEKFVQTKVKLTRPYYICDHELTVAEAKAISEKYSYRFAKSTYSTWDYVKKQLTDDCAFTGLTWVDCLVYCNLRSMDENLTPVYSLDGESDPRKWPFISKNNGIYEYTSSAYESWEVTGMSMNLDANGYRLPIEAEWDYAALGDYAKHKDWTSGNISKFLALYESNGPEYVRFSGYDGSGNQNKDDYVSPWTGYEYIEKTDSHTLPKIKQKKPNSFGLYDMTGNAAEWVWDADNYLNEITDWPEFMPFSKMSETDPVNSYIDTDRRFKRLYPNDHTYSIGQSSQSFDEASFNQGLRLVRTAK